MLMRTCLVLFGLSFLIYGSSLKNPFILDDVQQLVENPYVHELGKSLEFFKSSTMYNSTPGSEGLGGIYYKPLMMMIYSLLWQVSPNNPLGFHFFQLILHTVNALMVVLLLSNLTKWQLGSFLAGVIYLIHPINAEAVLMIADMQEPLYSFFGLAGLLVICRENKTSMSIQMILLACCLAFLSVLSKESGIQYAGMMAALYFIKFTERRITFLSLLSTMGCLYLTLRLGLADLSQVRSDNMAIMNADFSTRLLTVPKVLMHYLQLFIYPNGISLTQDWVVRETSLQNFYFPALGVLLTVTGLVLLNLWLRKSVGFFFSLWFFGGWLMHSQLIPLDGTVSDRWFYFTMIGLLGILLVATQQLLSRISARGFHSAGLALIALVVVLLAYRSYSRSADFKDALTLYTKDIQVDPDSFYLNNNLGLELLKAKRFLEAVPYFRKTIELSQPSGRAWFVAKRNLGVALLESGNWQEAELHFREVLPDPDPRSTYGMVMWFQRTGKLKELKEFVDREALPKFPSDPVLNRLSRELVKVEQD